MGSDIGSTNSEDSIGVSLLEILHWGEMTENQRQYLEQCVDIEQEHSDDDTTVNQRQDFVDCG